MYVNLAIVKKDNISRSLMWIPTWSWDSQERRNTNIQIDDWIMFQCVQELCKAVFTSEREQNANIAGENDANVRCRRIPEARQTAFGFAMNVRWTAECYPPNVGTSKEICIRYV